MKVIVTFVMVYISMDYFLFGGIANVLMNLAAIHKGFAPIKSMVETYTNIIIGVMIMLATIMYQRLGDDIRHRSPIKALVWWLLCIQVSISTIATCVIGFFLPEIVFDPIGYSSIKTTQVLKEGLVSLSYESTSWGAGPGVLPVFILFFLASTWYIVYKTNNWRKPEYSTEVVS